MQGAIQVLGFFALPLIPETEGETHGAYVITLLQDLACR